MIPSTLLGKWEGEEGTSLRNSRNCATADDEQSTVTSHNTHGPESPASASKGSKNSM